MVVHATDGHAGVADGAAEHPQAAQVGDVEHNDGIGTAEDLDGVGGAIEAGVVAKEELETGRCRGRVGDDDIHPLGPEAERQPDFAAEAVAIGVDVGGQDNPAAGHQQGTDRLGCEDLFGGEGNTHGAKIIQRRELHGSS